jgi:hypothetical protein
MFIVLDSMFYLRGGFWIISQERFKGVTHVIFSG